MIQDLRFSMRTLRTSKMLTLVAVLSLGLGIGVTSAIYAVVDQLLIHDVIAREPERLVGFNYGPWNSYPNLRDIGDSGVFAKVASDTGCYPAPRWREGDQTFAVAASCVSGNFFEVMGIQAERGRVLTGEEAAAEKNPRVVVITHQFWQRRLAGDPNVVGRILTLNHTDYTIVGVLPASYRANDEQVIVPVSTDLYPRLFERDSTTMALIGRLLPDRTPEQTQQALAAVLRGLEQQYPDKMKLRQGALPRLTPLMGLAKYGKDSWELKFSVMLGVVALLVLLLACANVAGLLLARGVTRRREIAIRLAVGATRWRLIRQFMVEAALLAAAGTAAGIGLALLASIILQKFPLRGSYFHFEFTPDWRFACAAVALGVSSAFLSGIAPALASSRMNLFNALRVSQSATPRLRLRSLMVVAQISVSVILLFGSFIFIRNLIHVLRFDPGFDAGHALQFDLTTTDPKIYPVALREKVYRELESHPGVGAVSWAWYMPFNFSYGGYQLRRANAPNEPVFGVTAQGIGPGYLKAMGIRLVSAGGAGAGEIDRAKCAGSSRRLFHRRRPTRSWNPRDPSGNGTVDCLRCPGTYSRAHRFIRYFDLQRRAAHAGNRHPHGARRDPRSRTTPDAARRPDAGCGRPRGRPRRYTCADTLAQGVSRRRHQSAGPGSHGGDAGDLTRHNGRLDLLSVATRSEGRSAGDPATRVSQWPIRPSQHALVSGSG